MTPVLAATSWLVQPPHNSEGLAMVMLVSYIAMPIALLATAAAGAAIAQWIDRKLEQALGRR
jgi:hypothetical protein